MRTSNRADQPFDANITADMVARRDRINERRYEMARERERHARNNRNARRAVIVGAVVIMVAMFDAATGGNSLALAARAVAYVWGMI